MRTRIAMGLAIGLLLGANAVKGADSLDGTWRLVAGEANGKALSDKQLQGGKLILKGDHYTVTLEGKGTVTGVQKLDPTSKIKTIDITNDTTSKNAKDNSAPKQDQTSLGIYEHKGNEFRVAFAPPGKARPSKFATTPESGYWMHVWKRVKE